MVGLCPSAVKRQVTEVPEWNDQRLVLSNSETQGLNNNTHTSQP